MKKAGYKRDGKRAPAVKDGKPLALGLLYNSNSVSEKTIAEYLQSEFGKLGMQISIRGEEEQSYRDNMKNGKFDMVFNICWGTPYDPQSSLAAMRQRVYGDYEAQLGLPDKHEIDAAITKILTSTDEKSAANSIATCSRICTRTRSICRFHSKPTKRFSMLNWAASASSRTNTRFLSPTCIGSNRF